MQHRQVDSGLGFEVDEGVLELVQALNSLPGIHTRFSCQGGPGEDEYDDPHGYVVLEGKFPGLVNLVGELMKGINRAQVSWKAHHRHVCRGCRSMSVQVEINGDMGFCLRWMPWDYNLLLGMIAPLVPHRKAVRSHGV